MSTHYRDPTSEAAEFNEQQKCTGCLWRERNPFNGHEWCDEPKWIGNDFLRPQTGGRNPMRKCAWFVLKVTATVKK